MACRRPPELGIWLPGVLFPLPQFCASLIVNRVPLLPSPRDVSTLIKEANDAKLGS